MSRITGSDAFGLMEAYAAVYAPQELTEEQVWEEVETWVNSLVEEGYDLSEYTWEDMYEAYIDEQDRIGDFFTKPIGYRGRTELRNRAPVQSTAKPAQSPAYRPAGGGMGGMRGSGRDRTSYQTSSSPGALRVQPTNAPYQSRFAGARDAAFARARQIQGSPVVGPRVSAPAPERPASAPATAPARPAVTSTTKPTVTAPTTSPVTAPAAPARTFNPLMQRTFGYQTGYAPSQVKQDPKKMAQMGSLRSISSSFDMFDVVQGYLIDEGYAETEEAAEVIMANMSEEWREEIIEYYVTEGFKPTGYHYDPDPMRWDSGRNQSRATSPRGRRIQNRVRDLEDSGDQETANFIHNAASNSRNHERGLAKQKRNKRRGPGPRRARADAMRDMRDSGF